MGHPPRKLVPLRNYQNYNWTCFEELKEHRLAEPEAAEAAATAEASEAKDVATTEPLTEAAVATAGA